MTSSAAPAGESSWARLAPVAAAREEWERLTVRPSFYLTYPWLRAMGHTVSPQLSLLISTEAGGTPLAGVPVARIGPEDYAPYDPVRTLLGISWPGPDPRLAEIDRALAPLRADPAGCYPALTSVGPGFEAGVCLAPGLRGSAARTSIEGLLLALEREARSSGCALAAILFFPEDLESPLPAAAESLGWRGAVIAAESLLDVRWDSFEDYLGSRVRTRRQSIRAEISAFERSGLRIERHGAEALDERLAPLHAQWRRKYGRAVSESELARQYALIREHLPGSVRLFLARREDRTLAFSLFLEQDGVLYSRSIGFDYQRLGRDFAYFNLLFYEPIREAIRSGLRTIHYSLESYEAKLGRGCRLRPCLVYAKAFNPAAASLLAQFSLIDAGMRAYLERLERIHRAGASP